MTTAEWEAALASGAIYSSEAAKEVICEMRARIKELEDRDIRHLPLFGASGECYAEAVIDAEDFEWARHFRWGSDRRPIGLIARYDKECKRRYLHREVMGLNPGDPRVVDHINHNRLDNRRSNLRVATIAENAQNLRSRGGKSRFRGVVWIPDQKKWRAKVMLNGKWHHIGYFEDEEEAGLAAADWRAENMPFSAEAAGGER